MSVPEIVCVSWVDSAIRHGQHHATLELADFGPVEMETVGWLIREDAVGVVIAFERIANEEGEIRDAVCVPREQIKKVVRLVPGARRRKK